MNSRGIGRRPDGQRCEGTLRDAVDTELHRITAPTLIVASDLDRHCPPKAAEIIAAGITGSRLEVMTGAGHPIPVEKPCELAASINAFLG